MLKFLCGITVSALVLAAEAPAPSCNAVPGWTQQGQTRSYEADNLFEYMDGNAEGYLLYGFQSMKGVSCAKGRVTLVIDISDFGDSDSAYGMFSANRDLRQPSVKIGMGGQIVPRRAIFVKGQYYVEIAADPEGDHTATLNEWSSVLEKAVPGGIDPPVALSWFPPGQETLRLIPESVLGIRALQRGYMGQSAVGKAFVTIEASPEAAAAVMQKLRTRFGETGAAKIGDEAFTASDKYLGRLCIFRKGNYVGGYGNVAEGQDPIALGTALASRIP